MMLGRNSANLMKNVVEAIQAAESACVKVRTYAHQPCGPTGLYSMLLYYCMYMDRLV